MTTKLKQLKGLQDRLEKATGNLDDWNPYDTGNYFTSGEIRRWSDALFKSSLYPGTNETLLRNALKGSVDATLALVERLLPGVTIILRTYTVDSHVEIIPMGHPVTAAFCAHAPTVALAILRALIAALIAQVEAKHV